MAQDLCESFAALSDSLGHIAGERVGDCIRDAFVAVMGLDGAAFLDSAWLLEWEGWENLRVQLLMHEDDDSAAATDAVFAMLSRYLRKLFKIASDNADVPLKSDEDRVQELQLYGLQRGQGLVFGRNDCLADSFLQSMVDMRL